MAAALPIARVDVSGNSVLDQIGNTPLILLEKLSAQTPGVQILVKDESRNPGGSVKDRPAKNMILDGERRGLLTRDKIIWTRPAATRGLHTR
jgi:cysteine synthase